MLPHIAPHSIPSSAGGSLLGGAEAGSDSFLGLVAADMLARFGTRLAHVSVVFPSRRARLFFNQYLYQHAQQTLWAPQYFSIEELFQEASSLCVADSIKLVATLYEAYVEVYNATASKNTSETLDEFYHFGEILLRDFDEVDKNMVNALSLFSNLQDLDNLKDDFSHLSEGQVSAISHYFKNTFGANTSLQTAFLSVWNILGRVYVLFKEKLRSQGLAYPGMLMREVVESPSESFAMEHYVFVGFNVLHKSEEQLFKILKPKALFYWDYDIFYLNDSDAFVNEAGRFIGANKKKFGEVLDKSHFDNFLSPRKKITIIASSSESGQASYIDSWIDSLEKAEFVSPDSAIVLCNEGILPSVVHAISPQKVANVNITMGFPLTQSPIHSFLYILVEMQIKGLASRGTAFRYLYVLPVLRHPYTQTIFAEASDIEQQIVQEHIFYPTLAILKDEDIFRPTASSAELAEYLLRIIKRLGIAYESPSDKGGDTSEDTAEDTAEDIYHDLYQESIFQSYQLVNRLLGLLANGEIHIEKSTFLRLLRKLLSSTSIPFHGEPIRGLQVMGVLETRSLDFKNILLLSTNEGFMPATENDSTFIPQFLRQHVGLSTVEHQDSVYAYYFYRLLQRAENITLIYNTDKTQSGKSEMSRFILQLLLDPRLNIERASLQASIQPLQRQEIVVEKTPQLLQALKDRYDISSNTSAQSLSPSAMNIFIDCSLRFYLQYVEELRQKDDLSEELDSSIFGTIFHRSAELLYRELGRLPSTGMFTPFVVSRSLLDLASNNSLLLDGIVAQSFGEEYFKGKNIGLEQYNGEQLINFRVVRHMLRRLIHFDMRRTPFTILGLEMREYADFAIPAAGLRIKIGGIIDRLEEKDGSIRIVDYKTSGISKTYKTIGGLLEQKDLRASHIFQTFVYASVLAKEQAYNLPIVPSLLYMQEAGRADYSSVIKFEKEEISDFRDLLGEFDAAFTDKVGELFDASIPFSQTSATSKCAYCDFKEMCHR
ncbi:hypothetical protein AwDysgo_11530 [Bacteroidales bacterium]|nr:hypothetical protein AwDysgo_11530 [Bacteroidales bacterium]